MKLFFLHVLLAVALLITSCSPNKNERDQISQTENLSDSDKKLSGKWQVISMPEISTPFDSLYSINKPTVIFDTEHYNISGNTSCNSFSGDFLVSNGKLNIKEPLTMTKMMCQGDGETVFLSILSTVDSYTIVNEKTLSLQIHGKEILRLIKQ